MMKKLGLILTGLLAAIFFLNGIYIAFFTEDTDSFRVLSLIPTNKIGAILIYFGLSGFYFYLLMKRRKNV